jgi:hypothetical protein
MALEDQIGVIIAALIALAGAIKAILDSRKNTAAVQTLQVGHAANAAAIQVLAAPSEASVDVEVLPTQQEGDSPFVATFYVNASPDAGPDQAMALSVDMGDGATTQIPLVNGHAVLTHTYTYKMAPGGKSGSKEFIPAFTARNASGKVRTATAHVYAKDPAYVIGSTT